MKNDENLQGLARGNRHYWSNDIRPGLVRFLIPFYAKFRIDRENRRSLDVTLSFIRACLLLACTLHIYLRIYLIVQRREFQGLIHRQPFFPLKYLGQRYLGGSFSTSIRGRFLLHHCRFLLERFSCESLSEILLNRAELWNRCVGPNRYSVDLSLSAEPSEGELSLMFRTDGISIFTLSFTFVPRWIAGLGEKNIILLSRLQGTKGCFEQIRLATKNLAESAPQMLLVSALAGIAESLRVERIVSTSASNQVCYQEDIAAPASGLVTAYDDFFAALGAVRISPDFFSLPVPIPEKPLSGIKRSHRRRTALKRQFRMQIVGEVTQSFLKLSKQFLPSSG